LLPFSATKSHISQLQAADVFYLPVAEAMERMDENCALLGRVLDLYVVFCSLGRVVSITTGFFSLSGMSESSPEGARY